MTIEHEIASDWPQQPPTREQIISAITCGNPNSVCDFEAEIADRVFALLQQPTPSAEPTASERWVQLAQDITEGNTDALKERLREVPGYVAEPPSIADMAPGTTLAVGYAFTALASWSEEDDEPDRWCKLSNGRYSLVGAAPGVDWDAECINWSTIRDVTPPKGVQ